MRPRPLKYDYMNLVDFIRSNILINNTTTIKSITKKVTPEIRKKQKMIRRKMKNN